jgi:trk system potassium uptake protein TrkA
MNYLIIGCGPMGAGVAAALAQAGHAVALVDKDAAALAHLEPRLRPHLTVGSAFDRDVLERAGIEKADGLAAMTHSDECNVVTARLARLVFQVPRVVARLCDPRKVEIYRRLGIQVAAPLSWSVNRFVELLSYSELEAVVSLGHGDVEIVQVEVNPFLDGRTVSALTVPGEARVVAVSRAGKTFLPSGETLLRCDDVAHIAVLADSVERLRTILALP